MTGDASAAAQLLTKDEARIAANIAKLPELTSLVLCGHHGH